jgi:hypothetical protein
MFDEELDLIFQICRVEVVFQQDAVFQGLMPSFDLSLGLRVIRRTSNVPHFLVTQPFSQMPVKQVPACR